MLNISPNIPVSIRKLIKATRFWQDNFVILREFKYFRVIAIIGLSGTLVAAILEGTTVGLLVSFLQVLTTPEKPPIETGIEWLDVSLLATKASPTSRIYRLSALILVAIWMRSLFRYLGLYYTRLSQSNLCDRIRKRLFTQLQSLSLSYYSTSRSGELLNTVTTEINQLKQAFQVFSDLIGLSFGLLAYLISMFWISWQLSLGAFMLYALLSVGLSSLMARVREASFAVPKANGQLTSVAIEFINGIRTIRASATQDFEHRRFFHTSTNIVEAEEKVASVSALVPP